MAEEKYDKKMALWKKSVLTQWTQKLQSAGSDLKLTQGLCAVLCFVCLFACLCIHDK
jgi:hypothetical protein